MKIGLLSRWNLAQSLTIVAEICDAENSGSAMRRKKTADERNWKEWFETRPLVVLAGAAVTLASATAAVVTYFFEQEKKIAEQSHAAELQQAKSDWAAKTKDCEGRLLSIERHVGTETIWDLNTILISARQAKVLGGEFTYFDDLQCYLSVPKSEAWTFKQTNELEFFGMIYGSKWLKDQLATPRGILMSDVKASCWRGPDAFEIETSDPQVPLHAFPYVFIERVNNQKLFEGFGKVVDEQEREAKRKAGQNAKRALDEKRDEKIHIGTAASSPSATETGSPGGGGENPGSTRPSEIEARKNALNSLVNSDLVGGVVYAFIGEGFNDAGAVKGGASYGILDAEKKGNVFFIHSQMVVPAFGARPKVYLDNEFICIGDNEDTVLIRTGTPSTDRRPPEAAWINNWLAGLRVVLR
jgi:hypothetical protein